MRTCGIGKCGSRKSFTGHMWLRSPFGCRMLCFSFVLPPQKFFSVHLFSYPDILNISGGGNYGRELLRYRCILHALISYEGGAGLSDSAGRESPLTAVSRGWAFFCRPPTCDIPRGVLVCFYEATSDDTRMALRFATDFNDDLPDPDLYPRLYRRSFLRSGEKG